MFLYFWPFFLKGEVIAPADLLMRFPPWSLLAPDDLHVQNVLRSDVMDARLPSREQIREGLTAGDLHLWNPLKAQGRPAASLVNTSIFHPLVLFTTPLFSLATGASLIVATKLAVAGLSMFLLLRRFEVSRGGSLLGGVAYMFCGFNVVWLMWPHTLVSTFAPLLFLMAENVVRRPRALNIALLAVAVALMILGGFPAVTGYFLYALALFAVVRLAMIRLSDRDWMRALSVAGGLTLAVVLGLALTAVQLVPTLEHIDFIDIGYREGLDEAGVLPREQMVQLVFPNYNGNQVFGDFVGPANLNESSGYIGIAALALAGWGLGMGVLKRRPMPAFFGALAILSLIVIYDIGSALTVVERLPVFDGNPNNRMLSVFGFSATALAGFGLDELRLFRPEGWLRRAVLLLATAAVATLAGMLAYVGYEVYERREIVEAFLDAFPSMEFHTFRLVTVGVGLAVLLAFASAVLLYLRGLVTGTALAVVAVLLVTGDLLVFAYRQNPTVPDDYFYPETPAIEFLQANQRPWERMAPFDGAFMVPGTQAVYGLSSSFNHALHTQRHRDFIRAFSDGAFVSSTAVLPRATSTDFSSPAVDLAGIRYVAVPYVIDLLAVYPSLEDEYDLVYANPDELRVYENSGFEPAFAVANVTQMEGDEVLEAITRADFDPRQTAIVEEAPPGWWSGEDVAVRSSVTVVRYDAEAVVYHVEASGPVLLATPELDHPGWRADVDGEGTEIHRVNYIFRGVFLPEGEHEVRFEYAPRSFMLGALISALALAGVVGLIVGDLAWRRLKGRGNGGARG